jgi:uncharacterized protein (TIGR03437 family)
VAPGTVVAIYGSNLASKAETATTIPLPTTLGGSSVEIGGITVPLYYAGPGQINAQAPFELDPSKRYQVVVHTGTGLTPPESVQMVRAAPGIAALADGTILAQHSDGSLVSATAPGRPNEYLVAYLLGMGVTDNAVATGAGSPFEPLARPVSTPTLTIGGTASPIAFAGLTPGLVGLYQLNFQVPADAPNGILPVVLIQNGLASNSVALPVRQ